VPGTPPIGLDICVLFAAHQFSLRQSPMNVQDPLDHLDMDKYGVGSPSARTRTGPGAGQGRYTDDR